MKRVSINNRRYLGNKHSLSSFILNTVSENCRDVQVVADVFSGTGAVANMFNPEKTVITNDILYSNYISHFAWFINDKYSQSKIEELTAAYNSIRTSEDNYMRQNFAGTYYSADVCSKIGYIREDIERLFNTQAINFKEYGILVTSLLYGIDKIANTVGHYDAFRRKASLVEDMQMPLVLPEDCNSMNQCHNKDANELIREIKSDLLYLDPPYNSRQYSDAYHLLENVAKWEKPEVHGVARKMDRKHIKSDYCTIRAVDAFEDLIVNADARYILLSYNSTSDKAHGRSNAKLYDDDIMRVLSDKGEVKVFEESYKTFTTGKSNLPKNVERLFFCEVK